MSSSSCVSDNAPEGGSRFAVAARSVWNVHDAVGDMLRSMLDESVEGSGIENAKAEFIAAGVHESPDVVFAEVDALVEGKLVPTALQEVNRILLVKYPHHAIKVGVVSGRDNVLRVKASAAIRIINPTPVPIEEESPRAEPASDEDWLELGLSKVRITHPIGPKK